MIFFQCAPLIHHAGHISFWGYRPVRLAVAPHMPRSLAWSAVLGVMRGGPPRPKDAACTPSPA